MNSNQFINSKTERGSDFKVHKYFHTQRGEVHASSPSLRIRSGGLEGRASLTSEELKGMPKVLDGRGFPQAKLHWTVSCPRAKVWTPLG